jgi:hypothetical protein
MKSYQLQLKDPTHYIHYIITDNEWFSPWSVQDEIDEKIGDAIIDTSVAMINTGVAIIYPEHNLLWIGFPGEKTERFKTLENFEKEFSSLPRWEATRYAVIESPQDYDRDDRIVSVMLFLYDCRTGEHLIDLQHDKPVPRRAAEVARVRRGLEQLMRGETWDLW